jgi:2-polyprenyl-6-methoxyphenol hydroxylase-like FAD-dependent oxidoreductase
MRLSRRPTDPGQTLGRIDTGRILVMLNREDYWQCAYVIPKGGFDQIRQGGLAAFREEIVRLAPCLGDRVGELDDWSDIKLLTVAVDRLRVWHRSGLLCNGDAAHAMSPIGGVGINLAIQDAVAAATSWPHAFCKETSARTTCKRCSAIESFRPARRSGSSCSSRIG